MGMQRYDALPSPVISRGHGALRMVSPSLRERLVAAVAVVVRFVLKD